jgi:hypothetical protein
MRHPNPGRVLTIAAWLIACAAAARADEAILYRPMMADLNESLIHVKVSSVTQDFRYGVDITDSTSVGGWRTGQSGVGWDVAAGKTFRTPSWRKAFGWAGPWKRYQLTGSALIRSNFERIEAQYINVNDFQFGGGFEAQWSGAGDDARGATSFDHPVLTTRTSFYHRSSHTGDEYVAQGNFGDNQSGPQAGTGLFPDPPVKRAVLSYEVIQQLFALEWSPLHGESSWRGYAGGEWKLGTMGRRPWNYHSPAAQLGLEFRSAGNRPDLGPDPLSGAINRVLRDDRTAFAWFAAADLRLAKPFNFASIDNPDGDAEVWTPNLWSVGAYGREFRNYAGSWHAMAGVSLWNPERRSASRGGRLAGPETAITLEWYHGYSPHGTFMDMRRSDHPRWYVVPSITTTF